MAPKALELLKLKDRLHMFDRAHPNMGRFMTAVSKDPNLEGAVVEIKVTTAAGKDYVTNLKLSKEDVESIGMVRKLAQ